ncbi:MAG: SDR family NAD(P)-dependent oxidoreductase [Thiothrix sp.]|nr:SDR family NAD(P)-dependent oxidoreductase [Thiothrix sp.]HPE60018.1 SDR family NAD(P)-dependent oxidoreductase [Thiolinea sp.]
MPNHCQHIVITGASNGIGAALAESYAAPGKVLGLIGRNRERLEQVAHRCRNQGAQVHLGQFDISDPAYLNPWLKDFEHRYPIDLLIANAGVTHSIGPDHAPEPLEAVCRLLEINLMATIRTVDPVLHAMRQRGHGQIALTSSLAAFYGMPVTPAYCASKAALRAWGEALRGQFAPEGIRINLICPGFVESDMSARFPGAKPFMISPKQAAHRIRRGLERNRAHITFPLLLSLGMRLLPMLPFPLASFFLGLSGYNRARLP